MGNHWCSVGLSGDPLQEVGNGIGSDVTYGLFCAVSTIIYREVACINKNPITERVTVIAGFAIASQEKGGGDEGQGEAEEEQLFAADSHGGSVA